MRSTCRWTSTRYGLRSDQTRLPKDTSKHEALARQIGADGHQLLDEAWAATSPPYLRTPPALEALRQMRVHNIIAVASRGWPRCAGVSRRSNPRRAVRLTSPYELEARYCTKRDTQCRAMQPTTETCEPEHLAR